jgi:hypothetical protein
MNQSYVLRFSPRLSLFWESQLISARIRGSLPAQTSAIRQLHFKKSLR